MRLFVLFDEFFACYYSRLQQFGWFCHGQAASAQDMAEVTTSEKPPSGGGSSETEADSLRRARAAETEATRNGRMLPTSDANASNDNSTSRSGSVCTKRKRAASVKSEPDADTEHAAATASDDDAPTASRNGSVPVAPADATNVTPANTLATPQHFDTIAPLSHSSLAQQWFARAEDLLQRSLTIDSSNAITHYLLGRCFMAQHKARDAYQGDEIDQCVFSHNTRHCTDVFVLFVSPWLVCALTRQRINKPCISMPTTRRTGARLAHCTVS